MNILALEPYHGGSHRAFLDGWVRHSCHKFTLLGLPDSHWKWRMRHAAITFAAEADARYRAGERWDAIWASDMLNLAELRGLAREDWRELPAILYFHENQLTYPVREERERDLHFAFTNFISCLAADAIWFNSRFHRHEFLTALPGLLRAMPDRQPTDSLPRIEDRSTVQAPGIEIAQRKAERLEGPLRILWAARWEHDKNPTDLFAALSLLANQGIDFRLAVVGESYREQPTEFADGREQFAARIDHWGFQPTRADYEQVLHWADCIVSTARHEFFGLSVVEAIAAGCRPLLPWRLAYPELLLPDWQPRDEFPAEADGFYDGSVTGLADKLQQCASEVGPSGTAGLAVEKHQPAIARFVWSERAAAMDRAIETACDDSRNTCEPQT